MLRFVSAATAVAAAACAVLLCAALLCVDRVRAQEPEAPQGSPDGYPADYADVIQRAKQEGKLSVYATVDTTAADPLIRDFRALYPGITVEFSSLGASALFGRFSAEFSAGPTVDVLWSSALALQMKLADDGKAATYASPELPSLPAWAVWQNQAYGTTYDPATFVYNKRSVPAADVPQDHAALLRLLTGKTDAYRGKLTAYDPERSDLGYLLAHEDAGRFAQAWDLFRVFGRTGIKLDTAAAGMIERVASGERTIAYDIPGSDVLFRAKKVPGLGIVVPKDYTLVVSRIALISRQARDPNAARLFLDYLLSRRGQTIMANQAGLYALRDDVAGDAGAKAIGELVGDKVQPIPIDRQLLTHLDGDKRNEFLQQWRAAMKGR